MTLATNRAIYDRAWSLLRQWGWGGYLEVRPGAYTRTNSRIIMTPRAVTNHHTGSRATATSYMENPRDRAALRVLCNIHITRDHRIKLVAVGGASHAGYVHKPCYDRIVSGTAPLDRDLVPGRDSAGFSANRPTVGIEVDGAGGASEWDDWMHHAVVATNAALIVAGGWARKGGAMPLGAHKELTLRKPGDPYMSMGTLRREVAAFIAKPYGPGGDPAKEPTPTAVKPSPVKSAVSTVVAAVRFPLSRGYFGPEGRGASSVSGWWHREKDGSKGHAGITLAQKRLNALGYQAGTPDGLYGPRGSKDPKAGATGRAVYDFQRRNGLSADGLLGPATWRKLFAPTAKKKG